MPRRKAQKPEEKTEAPPTEPLEAAEPQYYSRTTWKGLKDVFKCETCGTFRDDEDGMIMHVLSHYPKHEQEALLDQLLKEK